MILDIELRWHDGRLQVRKLDQDFQAIGEFIWNAKPGESMDKPRANWTEWQDVPTESPWRPVEGDHTAADRFWELEGEWIPNHRFSVLDTRVFATKLPRQIERSDEMHGYMVIVGGKGYKIVATELFMHAPPWRAGEGVCFALLDYGAEQESG